MRYIGTHPVDNGGIDMAVRRSANAGMKAVQIFTAIPKYYGDKTTIRPERIERFKKALVETGMEARMVMAHAAYVLNTATPEDDKWSRARGGLIKELERSTLLGIGSICFHPGAATDGDRDAAAKRVARAIIDALEQHPASTTRVLIENTAGAGRTFAKTPDEIASILNDVPARLRARTGYGLDTCHLFSSGYDIRNGGITSVIDEFERTIGERPRFFHLNDSEGGLGSNKDRHVLIGEGQIGVEPFRRLLEDPRTVDIPLILETPQINVDVADDDPAGDPYDVRMYELLTGSW
ncbi:MAG TPA: deoxyribonuclease IV [Gemmatimonadaceae bacterium]|nr:deoxyribonuclease IV [Gemmatimonadaceae bacterium]